MRVFSAVLPTSLTVRPLQIVFPHRISQGDLAHQLLRVRLDSLLFSGLLAQKLIRVIFEGD